MAACGKQSLCMATYVIQAKTWPKEGHHILAQYDDNSVVVYQAYKPTIAEYAVKNQRFGGPDFSFARMSWVKTNFLWMMYRSGWAQKQGQERILAVRITKQGFEEILSQAYTAKLQNDKGLTKEHINVRLQWDPDHTPKMDNCSRRAIQLGLKGKILEKYGTEFIVSISDITEMVHEQYNILITEGEDSLQTPAETVYHVQNPDISARIGVSHWEAPPTVVKLH